MSLAIFPKFMGLTYSIAKTPIGGRTLTQESASGKEFRLGLWSKGSNRHKLTLNFEFFNTRQQYPNAAQLPVAAAMIIPNINIANDFDAMRGFFLEMQGSLTEFLLDATVDEDPAVQTNFGTTDGTSTVFQLVRGIGGHSEIVQNVNGTPILPTAQWTANRSNLTNDLIIPTNTAIFLQGGRTTSYIQQIGWPYYFKCTTPGTSGTIEPNWRSLQFVGQTITDGSTTWTFQGVPIVIYVNAVAVNPSTYSIGPTGQVTFTSGVATPGQTIAWTGAYYYRCKFVEDMNQFDQFWAKFYKLGKCDIISLKS